MTKEKTARVIPNAVQICTKTDKLFFTSFGARDKTYLMLFRVWQNALMEQVSSPYIPTKSGKPKLALYREVVHQVWRYIKFDVILRAVYRDRRYIERQYIKFDVISRGAISSLAVYRI